MTVLAGYACAGLCFAGAAMLLWQLVYPRLWCRLEERRRQRKIDRALRQ